MELRMATELFDELRGEKEFLSVEQFKQWDEVRDLVDADVMDDVLLQELVAEVDPEGRGQLDFEQFLSLVDMVNEVYLLAEQELDIGELIDDEETEEDEGTAGLIGNLVRS